MARTIKTHNNRTYPPYDVFSSGWISSGNYKRIAITHTSDKAKGSSVHVHWSHDAVNLAGMDSNVTTGNGQWKSGATEIKAQYFRIQCSSNEATDTLIINVWARLMD